MKNLFKIAVIMGALATSPPDIAAQSAYGSATEAPATSNFIKKRYNIKGTWDVTQQDGQNIISFNDDFRTKGGPDLKLYLSSKTLAELESGDVEHTSVKLSVLKSNKGAQSYIVPKNVNLSDFKSVVIHCEAFSVLWGGFDIS